MLRTSGSDLETLSSGVKMHQEEVDFPDSGLFISPTLKLEFPTLEQIEGEVVQFACSFQASVSLCIPYKCCPSALCSPHWEHLVWCYYTFVFIAVLKQGQNFITKSRYPKSF
jgi:hypothetical protein